MATAQIAPGSEIASITGATAANTIELTASSDLALQACRSGKNRRKIGNGFARQTSFRTRESIEIC